MSWELACPALRAIVMERARRAGNGSGGVESVARNTGKDRRIGEGQRYATKLLLSVGFWTNSRGGKRNTSLRGLKALLAMNTIG